MLKLTGPAAPEVEHAYATFQGAMKCDVGVAAALCYARRVCDGHTNHRFTNYEIMSGKCKCRECWVKAHPNLYANNVASS